MSLDWTRPRERSTPFSCFRSLCVRCEWFLNGPKASCGVADVSSCLPINQLTDFLGVIILFQFSVIIMALEFQPGCSSTLFCKDVDNMLPFNPHSVWNFACNDSIRKRSAYVFVHVFQKLYYPFLKILVVRKFL